MKASLIEYVPLLALVPSQEGHKWNMTSAASKSTRGKAEADAIVPQRENVQRKRDWHSWELGIFANRSHPWRKGTPPCVDPHRA